MAAVPFMRPPDLSESYQVGDTVEAYCDHEKGDQRIKGWLRGTVVQIDGKLIAVQFPIRSIFNRWLDGAGPYTMVSPSFITASPKRRS